MNEELYILYIPEIVQKYLGTYYIQYVYRGWVLLRKRKHP